MRTRAPEIPEAPSPLPGPWSRQSSQDGGSQGLDESGPGCFAVTPLITCLCTQLLPWRRGSGGAETLLTQPRDGQGLRISAVLGAGLRSQQVLGLNPGFAVYQEALLGGLLSPQPHICKLRY